MFLSIKEMELCKVCFETTFAPGQIDFAGENLVQRTPLVAKGVAELLASDEGEVRIEGRYTVELEAVCDRCLGLARFPLEAGFDLYYRPASVIAREEEVEIDADEAEIGFYEGDTIGMEDVLREQVMLALPMQRVCSESCRGICPVCGGNRNETACDCKTIAANDQWGALRELK